MSTTPIESLPAAERRRLVAIGLLRALATTVMVAAAYYLLPLDNLAGISLDAEPKTLRYRLLRTAARIVRGQRRRKIKIPRARPWADELAVAFHATFALTAPT